MTNLLEQLEFYTQFYGMSFAGFLYIPIFLIIISKVNKILYFIQFLYLFLEKIN